MNIVSARYGRGWQGSIRDRLHNGRYNSTQAGFRDYAGAPVELRPGPGRMEILRFDLPLYSDPVFDFTAHEDLAEDSSRDNDGLNMINKPSGKPYGGDTDGFDGPGNRTLLE